MILSLEKLNTHERNKSGYIWTYILCGDCLNIYWIVGSYCLSEQISSQERKYRIKYSMCPECGGQIKIKCIRPDYYILYNGTSKGLQEVVQGLFRVPKESWEYNSNIKEFITPNDIEYYTMGV